MLRVLKESVQMFGKWVITGWHICFQKQSVNSNGMDQLVKILQQMIWQRNILIDFSPFCWAETIPSCISILKTVQKSRLAAFWPHRNHHEIYFRMLLSNKKWLEFVSVSCLKNYVLFAAKLDYLHSLRDVTEVCTDAWCMWYLKYEHQDYC